MTRTSRPTILAVAVLGMLLSGCGDDAAPPPSAQTRAAVRSPMATSALEHLDPAAFAGRIATAGTVLLDVRTPEEFAAGHLAGATNLDFRAPDFAARLAALDHAATYAIYCHSGNRSGQALQLMASDGFAHAADLAGGITAWQAAGLPLAEG